ncbi:hypothetical protein SODG_003927 [Sodalis praecaptivus]
MRPSFNFHLLSPLNKVNIPRRFERFSTQGVPWPRRGDLARRTAGFGLPPQPISPVNVFSFLASVIIFAEGDVDRHQKKLIQQRE